MYKYAPESLILAILFTIACTQNIETKTLSISGIPDQSSAELVRRFEILTDHLESQLNVKVEYIPTISYAATVEAFKRGEIQLAWLGGLSGVQARNFVSGSKVIAQRERDASFHSKFIAQSNLKIKTLSDLEGLTFTFGSPNSTSGHLMPRHFLLKSGINPETDFQGIPSFSGSHDKTWALVESGAYQAGVLSEAVWDAAVDSGRVDTTKVKSFYTSPPYYDYNWTVRGDLDESYGEGFTEQLKSILIGIDNKNQEVLDLFNAKRFISSDNSNYVEIENIARSLKILE